MIATSPDTRNLEKFINKKYEDVVNTPLTTRSRSVKKQDENFGYGVIFTKRKPAFKWINY